MDGAFLISILVSFDTDLLEPVRELELINICNIINNIIININANVNNILLINLQNGILSIAHIIPNDNNTVTLIQI